MSPTLVYAATFSTTAGSLTPPQDAKARAEAQKSKDLSVMVNWFSSVGKDNPIFPNIVNFVTRNKMKL